MTKKIPIEVVAAEAKNLRELAGSMGPTEIGEQLRPKRSKADVHQHLTGKRPIPLSAAKAYARLFGCSIDKISPRWASELDVGASEIAPPVMRTKIRKLLSFLEHINDDGIQELIGQARRLKKEYPINQPEGKKAA